MVSEVSAQSVGNWAGGAVCFWFESQLKIKNNGKWAGSRRPRASCTKTCMDSAVLFIKCSPVNKNRRQVIFCTKLNHFPLGKACSHLPVCSHLPTMVVRIKESCVDPVHPATVLVNCICASQIRCT